MSTNPRNYSKICLNSHWIPVLLFSIIFTFFFRNKQLSIRVLQIQHLPPRFTVWCEMLYYDNCHYKGALNKGWKDLCSQGNPLNGFASPASFLWSDSSFLPSLDLMSLAADIILSGELFLQKPYQFLEPRLLVLESAEVAGGGGEEGNHKYMAI